MSRFYRVLRPYPKGFLKVRGRYGEIPVWQLTNGQKSRYLSNLTKKLMLCRPR